MSCQVCGNRSASGQFCVSCGQLLATSAATAVGTQERERPQRTSWLAFQEIRLLACPRCGAPNSAARWRCARCGHGFTEAADDTPSAELTPPEAEAPAVQPESAPWLAVITGVVGVAAVGLAVALLVARGFGPFGGDGPATPVSHATQATVEKVRASTNEAGAGAELVHDGDVATAWHSFGAGDVQWIELRLASPAKIDHLLVSNGDQRSTGAFDETARVRDVVITFPDVDRSYTAEFPDSTGRFRVDMQDPPVSSRVRIVVENAWDGRDEPVSLAAVDGVALSEVTALIDDPVDTGGTAGDSAGTSAEDQPRADG